MLVPSVSPMPGIRTETEVYRGRSDVAVAIGDSPLRIIPGAGAGEKMRKWGTQSRCNGEDEHERQADGIMR
jgi:hypothetical protein